MSGNTALSWEEDQPARPWQRHLTLPGLLALGWLVFEATSQPALGIVIVCVKFGWNDLLTAYWLRIRDPKPGRGRTCFWLYLNSGFLKIGAWAFGFCLLLGIMQTFMDPKNPAPLKAKNEAVAIINHTGGVGLGAFALGSLLALPTLWWAWRTRTRLWLDPALHQARRRDHWPPSLADSTGKNRARFVLPIAVIFLIVSTTIWALETWVRGPGKAALGIAAALTLIPGMILVFRELLFDWALAKNPGECWDNDLASGGREPSVEWTNTEMYASQQGACAPRSPSEEP